MTERTILKLEIVLREVDGVPYAPSYRMEYDDADQMAIEVHVTRLADSLRQWNYGHHAGYVERVR